MNNEKDKDLDNLFKKRLEDPVDPVDFEENDWLAMEQMLKTQKRRGIIYWLPVISSVAALLLIALGWWMFKPKADDANPKNQMAAVTRVQKTVVDTAKGVIKQPVVQATTTQQVAKAQSESSTIIAATAPKTLKHHEDVIIAHGVLNNPAAVTLAKTSPGAAGNQPVIAKDADTETIAVRQNTELIAALSPAHFNENEALAVLPITTTEIPKSAYAKVAAESADGKIKTPAKPGAFHPQYALSVLAAPDVNGVGSFQNGKVGSNVGLLFSVGVSKKFTISTGALYSVKPYLSGFSDYHSAYQFQVNPVSVLADCRALDVPLNVGYQVYNNHQNKFSIGTGLSSYIMLHQSYTYNYATPGTPGPEYFNVKNNAGYYFGIANFNATYERQLNSKVGLVVSPYLKVPLGNIGYSQVRLQSTGVAVGLNWNLN